MIYDFPYMSSPLEDDIRDFVADVVRRYIEGTLGRIEYYVALGKVLGYVECRFSVGLICDEEAHEFISDIEGRI